MAKLPVYTTTATPTLSTGKRSWRTRIDSRPFIKEIMAKNEIGRAVVDDVASFFVKRDETRREALAGQALQAAEGAMQATMSALAQAENPAAVFGEDVTAPESWAGALMDIRSQASEALDPGSRRLFNQRIGSLEARYSAAMRTKIDARINQNIIDQFEYGAAMFENQYADINNADNTIFLYDAKLAEMRNQGGMLIAQGRMNADDVVKRIDTMVFSTAQNALTYLITGAENPLAMAQALQDMGNLDSQQYVTDTPSGEYVLHLLRQIPSKAERIELINKTADIAYDARENKIKMQNQLDKEVRDQLKLDYNSLFGLSREEAQAVFDRLDAANFMTPQAREVAEAYIRGSGVFAEFDDTEFITQLEYDLSRGMLATETLIAGSRRLTQSTFQSYMGKVGTKRSQSVSAAMKDAAVAFRYEERRGTDVEPYEQAAMQAYYLAQSRIMQYERDNQNATAAQIRDEAQKIILQEKQGLIPIVEIEITQTLRTLDKLKAITLPRLSDGSYDYSQVMSYLAEVVKENPSALIEANLTDLNYYLGLIRSLRDE